MEYLRFCKKLLNFIFCSKIVYNNFLKILVAKIRSFFANFCKFFLSKNIFLHLIFRYFKGKNIFDGFFVIFSWKFFWLFSLFQYKFPTASGNTNDSMNLNIS